MKLTFEKYIASQGLKMTRQRGLILEIFLKKEGHISPEELYSLVRKKDATVGRATVYRMLKLLKEADIAREVDFGDGFSRYEHKYGHAHHDHLICTKCGKTMEVVDEEIEALQEKLAGRHGFSLTSHEMDLFGLCPECREKEARVKRQPPG
ncbi:MAG: Fur family transcriptional regulator [Nitrospiraceae bacterium]|nr:Fur family transcriptional regulator [Nitrospiraceae bacterium]